MTAVPPAAVIGILTVSDRASRGAYADEGGPAIRDYLREVLVSPWEPRERIVPDDLETIAAVLRELADCGCCLIVTTGGTGPAPRDVTPEATERVCTRLLPGFGELMRQESLKHVPTAILSRQTAGICGRALVVNLPGDACGLVLAHGLQPRKQGAQLSVRGLERFLSLFSDGDVADVALDHMAVSGGVNIADKLHCDHAAILR
jgi:molybdopterin adenylyltransferase